MESLDPPSQPTLEQQLLAAQARIQQLERQYHQEVARATEEIKRSFHPHKGIKVAHPDPYDGARAKFPIFMRQLNLYFRANPVDYELDDNRITLALSYMKDGTAGSWADNMIRESEDGYAHTWKTFVQALTQQFADPDEGDTARTKLKELRQGRSTADEYVVSFEMYEHESGYDEVALMERFEEGLSPALADAICRLPQAPVTIADWKFWAQKLDRQWRKREGRKRQLAGHSKPANHPAPSGSPPSTNNFRATSKPAESQYVPMDIDQSRSRNFGERKPLICWKCRKPGHRAVDCKERINVMEMTYEEIRKIVTESEEKKDF
jgi:hypothetical protein